MEHRTYWTAKAGLCGNTRTSCCTCVLPADHPAGQACVCIHGMTMWWTRPAAVR